MRPMGIWRVMCWRAASGMNCMIAVMLVSMNPGPMLFTRIPADARSRASFLVRYQTPAFDTP